MGGVTITVVEAFTSIEGTENAGMVAYYRAPGCTEVTIADVLPILSKINYYEDEYVIGEMLIWDTGTIAGASNNCTMVRVIIYNDGWICAWFDKTTYNQLGASGLTYIDAQTLSGWGTALEYDRKFNNCILEITASIDPDCPVGTLFPIENTDQSISEIEVYINAAQEEEFHSGYTYSADIYMTNGNMVWWGHNSGHEIGAPPLNSNKLYRTIFEIWNKIKYSSNSSNYTVGNTTKAYMYDSQTDVYTDETTDFNDVGIDDCQLFPTDEVINDAFYIGNNNKFNGVSITMGTFGIGSGITWEYYNGSAWSSLSVVDGSSGFTANGELTFNPPDNWTENYVNTTNCYWIRARITTASYTTIPLLSQGQLYIQNDTSYTDTEFGMYNFEFTSANYCLICGISESIQNKYYYYTQLPGKTTYDNTMNISASGKYHPPWYLEKVYLNGVLVWEGYFQNGFYSINVDDIVYTPGIQNAVLGTILTSGTPKSIATVLITS